MANVHKDDVAELLRELLVQAGYRDNDALARQLLLLMDGATVTELYQRSSAPAHQAKAMAQSLLEHADHHHR